MVHLCFTSRLARRWSLVGARPSGSCTPGRRARGAPPISLRMLPIAQHPLLRGRLPAAPPATRLAARLGPPAAAAAAAATAATAAPSLAPVLALVDGGALTRPPCQRASSARA